MHVRDRVELEDGERQQLALVAGGTRGGRIVKRAQILLAAAAGRLEDEIAGTLRVGTSTAMACSAPPAGRPRPTVSIRTHLTFCDPVTDIDKLGRRARPVTDPTPVRQPGA